MNLKNFKSTNIYELYYKFLTVYTYQINGLKYKCNEFSFFYRGTVSHVTELPLMG